ncbi:SagB/ThcOx family dehydrogenase [Desulfogranum japonicum]|uniref:SagB/ThcOx family dehydrogenase n=1 Tax=Desulfogranum japonicum TaxID=231447 RepID=UPI000424E182|nr:SagB/ThcOx family dehydrogenase [Desulfogranum japonicum]
MTGDPWAYHQESKHAYQQFAPSPDFLDWETQPDPFRSFQGAPRIQLPFLRADPEAAAEELFTGEVPFHDVSVQTIAALLELSMGLSVWKEVPGSRWALRMNPSSGNLHPTEVYLINGNYKGLTAGVYHYAPFTHCLEQRCAFSSVELSEGLYIALTSIFWRESWKYGMRAFRYCQLDVGHAMAAIRFAANLMGWQAQVCTVGDDVLSDILGFTQTQWHEGEREYPDVMLWVGNDQLAPHDVQQVVAGVQQQKFTGIPNQLSSDHQHWKRMYDVARATSRSGILTQPVWETDALREQRYQDTGAAVIRRRRSAVDMDRQGSQLEKKQLFNMLDVLLPRENCAPFDIALGASRVHPVLFIHNVQGLQPGIYIQIRNREHLAELKQQMHQDFLWQPIFPEISFYLLTVGDARSAAATFACGQDICGNGVFAVSMLARFRKELEIDVGRYRELYWEAGCIGQVLYLHAELNGMRGTGIGCFFDDPVHDFLGIDSDAYQSVYHFTVGNPVEDKRLSSRAPYFHVRSG